MLVPHLMKIYFGLGWPSSVLEVVSVTKIKKKIFIESAVLKTYLKVALHKEMSFILSENLQPIEPPTLPGI